LAATTHLNDHHYWSRERIADWIDQLQVKPVAEQEKPEAVAV
jgi:hypothetical protein